jgi:hypothetical protein
VEEDKPDLWFKEGSDLRTFCPTRYGLSLDLRTLIEAQANHKAYFSDERPFLIIDPSTRRDCDGPYCVFFNLERARQRRDGVDVRMFVVSAYRKPALPENLPVVYFSTLAAKVARGEEIKRPR